MLRAEGTQARLLHLDIFDVSSPADLGVDAIDAVVGNPPFVRYQLFNGSARSKGLEQCLRQGVRLSGLSSSWAPVLVHSASLLSDAGRLAMVLPSELISVNYAQPVRQWLKTRFQEVTIVCLEGFHFSDAVERVVLLLARGRGTCTDFRLAYVRDADELGRFNLERMSVPRSPEAGKWLDLLLSSEQRRCYREAVASHFVSLSHYGRPELGTVTGANAFFTLSESTRLRFGVDESDLLRISPPGTRHLKGLRFTRRDWNLLRESDARVWMLQPGSDSHSGGLQKYIRLGALAQVDKAYKCRVRTRWWKPSAVPAPDLFFTYMSHHYPRLIKNSAGVTYLNSMHGVRLNGSGNRAIAKEALPLLMLNSVSMLGAEINGRYYGGGVLKMEPREAARLPVPTPEHLAAAWLTLRKERDRLDTSLRDGRWAPVVKRVDEVLLRDTLGSGVEQCELIQSAVTHLRRRRLKK